ncbi:bZIP transcription factor 12-like [Tasmannia lanceolata]|uniref:bZIP transcription factor 12-like n=1 Tax=Tasmannia lanceolata TaxID=3420 RepID=UPI0040632C2C
MASVMKTSGNSDLTHQSSSSMYELGLQSSNSIGDPNNTFASMNMDELIRNMYADNPTVETLPHFESNGGGGGSMNNKTVDEIWKEISGDRKIGVVEGLVFNEEMTLEDFLAKAGAGPEEDVRVRVEEDIRVRVSNAQGGGYQVDLGNRFGDQQVEGSILGFGNGVEGGGGGGGGVRERGKRRAVQEPVDRVAQQRQRRMIKNRESAARSRERKQAYTVELESLVMRLEEENAQLVREQVEQTKKRLKQLMENRIPVLEKQRPPRVLRKTSSMKW